MSGGHGHEKPHGGHGGDHGHEKKKSHGDGGGFSEASLKKGFEDFGYAMVGSVSILLSALGIG